MILINCVSYSNAFILVQHIGHTVDTKQPTCVILEPHVQRCTVYFPRFVRLPKDSPQEKHLGSTFEGFGKCGRCADGKYSSTTLMNFLGPPCSPNHRAPAFVLNA